jgi:hypothetical protein
MLVGDIGAFCETKTADLRKALDPRYAQRAMNR